MALLSAGVRLAQQRPLASASLALVIIALSVGLLLPSKDVESPVASPVTLQSADLQTSPTEELPSNDPPLGILERQAYGPGLGQPLRQGERREAPVPQEGTAETPDVALPEVAYSPAEVNGESSVREQLDGPQGEALAKEERSGSWWPFSRSANDDTAMARASEGLPQLALDLGPYTRIPLVLGPPTDRYIVAKGDTLSDIFSRFDVGQSQMYQVLEADYAYLALDTLIPGNELRFWIDHDSQRLEKMAVVFDPAHKVAYQRHQETFEVTETLLEGDWMASSSEVEIQGSFSLAASKAGLRASEVQQITALFNDKLDFRRQLRAGDRARILRESQYIDGKPTGNQRLLAVEFAGRNWTSTAYLHSDGSFYDEDGQSLNRAFMRHPISGNYRVSSRFNPRRLHPVTRRVSPHNGTDYAASTGTPILAAGDGVISRVENHPIAGKYVVIDHGGRYRTRYLHMARIDVRRGQTVERGQRIGTVGATGRVTGAHLHYEFHINGRAVNSLTANIPMATSVPSSERQAFLAEVYRYQRDMNELLAKVETEAVPERAN
ncbi:peptidoglycan DD-metalloendopeptidase family protein [Ferrimonas gelatinilytica]|uniref:Peptidase M23 n=1 Tax=Ferrimonas gelatinilytica TaxID=1255257 RepID=A0ABP9RYC9_9GAMM